MWHLVPALSEPLLPPALLVAGPEAATGRRDKHLQEKTKENTDTFVMKHPGTA